MLAHHAELQELSRTLFGQTHRLAVMIGIAWSDGVVSPGDLAYELGFRAQSSIQDPIKDLTSSGLIQRLPKIGNKTYYQRVDSKVWEWILELADNQHLEPSRR